LVEYLKNETDEFMKKVHFILLAICISILQVECTDKSQKAILTADIENIESDTIKIAMAPYNERLSDAFITIYARDGKFILDTLIEKLHYGKIISNQMFERLPNGEEFLIRSKIIDFFIYPEEKIEITGNMGDLSTKYQINGNILNEQQSKYREIVTHDLEESSKLMYQIESSYLNNSSDSIIHILESRESKAYKKYIEKSLKFIRENPNLEYSAFLLLMESKDDIIRFFPSLDNDVKKSVFGELIEERIEVWNKINVGSEAPDFEYSTFNNQIIRLSDYRGKYVVLDFWGSWCGPCKMEIPKLKEFYTMNMEDVELIGIACRDTKENLGKALEEYRLKWTQILNNKEQQDLSKKFGIKGFPTKIIISPVGIIEGIYLGIDDDFFIKMSELLSQEKQASIK
jgi:thiol-disulfide isomerase/thioredoxin